MQPARSVGTNWAAFCVQHPARNAHLSRRKQVAGSGTLEHVVAELAVQSSVVDELRQLLPPEQVLWRDYDLMLYEYDGSIDKHRPLCVVFRLSTEQVSAVVRACHH